MKYAKNIAALMLLSSAHTHVHTIKVFVGMLTVYIYILYSSFPPFNALKLLQVAFVALTRDFP